MARMKKTEREALKREIGIRDVRIQSLEYANSKYKALVKAHEDMKDINLAMCTAVVMAAGEVTITQDQINDILKKGIYTHVKYDEDSRTYTLSVPPADKT